MKELKCSSGRLLGNVDEGVIEISCRSTRCGKEPGVTVVHCFDVNTGELIRTRRFAQPTLTKGVSNGTRHEGTALRTA